MFSVGTWSTISVLLVKGSEHTHEQDQNLPFYAYRFQPGGVLIYPYSGACFSDDNVSPSVDHYNSKIH